METKTEHATVLKTGWEGRRVGSPEPGDLSFPQPRWKENKNYEVSYYSSHIWFLLFAVVIEHSFGR
jgi:hypothetical protein